MTTFRTVDGTIFTAQGATAFLAELRNRSFNPELSLPLYAVKTAAAATLQTGQEHRHDTPENLLADLITSGLVEAFQMDKKDTPQSPAWFQ